MREVVGQKLIGRHIRGAEVAFAASIERLKNLRRRCGSSSRIQLCAGKRFGRRLRACYGIGRRSDRNA